MTKLVVSGPADRLRQELDKCWPGPLRPRACLVDRIVQTCVQFGSIPAEFRVQIEGNAIDREKAETLIAPILSAVTGAIRPLTSYASRAYTAEREAEDAKKALIGARRERDEAREELAKVSRDLNAAYGNFLPPGEFVCIPKSRHDALLQKENQLAAPKVSAAYRPSSDVLAENARMHERLSAVRALCDTWPDDLKGVAE